LFEKIFEKVFENIFGMLFLAALRKPLDVLCASVIALQVEYNQFTAASTIMHTS
jgi:hypothetical protein